jgi:hypothetical protein
VLSSRAQPAAAGEAGATTATTPRRLHRPRERPRAQGRVLARVRLLQGASSPRWGTRWCSPAPNVASCGMGTGSRPNTAVSTDILMAATPSGCDHACRGRTATTPPPLSGPGSVLDQ